MQYESRAVSGVWSLYLPLLLTTGLATLGLLVALLQRSTLSFVTYWVVLCLGTGAVAYHRWREGRASLSADYVIPTRWRQRLALVPVVLLLLASVANAFVWATEVAKI